MSRAFVAVYSVCGRVASALVAPFISMSVRRQLGGWLFVDSHRSALGAVGCGGLNTASYSQPAVRYAWTDYKPFRLTELS